MSKLIEVNRAHLKSVVLFRPMPMSFVPTIHPALFTTSPVRTLVAVGRSTPPIRPVVPAAIGTPAFTCKLIHTENGFLFGFAVS